MLCPAARLQKEVLQIFCNPQCCHRFPRTSSNRSMVPKMILRLGFVDLVDRIASSILVRHVAILELSEPFGRAHPEFSHKSLSQCKLQVVCCRERLHVTVFAKIASLSLERASTYTSILSFERRFQVFLYGAILDFVRSHGVSHHTIYVFHRVHCSEEYRLSSSLEAFSSCN